MLRARPAEVKRSSEELESKTIVVSDSDSFQKLSSMWPKDQLQMVAETADSQHLVTEVARIDVYECFVRRSAP